MFIYRHKLGCLPIFIFLYIFFVNNALKSKKIDTELLTSHLNFNICRRELPVGLMIKFVFLWCFQNFQAYAVKFQGFSLCGHTEGWADTTAFLIMNLYLFTLLLTVTFNQHNAWSVCGVIKTGLSWQCQIHAVLEKILGGAPSLQGYCRNLSVSWNMQEREQDLYKEVVQMPFDRVVWHSQRALYNLFKHSSI